MTTVEAITAAIAELPHDQVARVRAWLEERAEAEWDTEFARDERLGKLDALADRALADHRSNCNPPGSRRSADDVEWFMRQTTQLRFC